MDIQYYHQNVDPYGMDYCNKRTVAVGLLPGLEINLQAIMLTPPETITLKVGVALCHSKDRYCKKTGRVVAESKMSDVNFSLRTVSYSEDNTQSFYLKSTDPKSPIDIIVLETKSTRTRVFFRKAVLK